MLSSTPSSGFCSALGCLARPVVGAGELAMKEAFQGATPKGWTRSWVRSGGATAKTWELEEAEEGGGGGAVLLGKAASGGWARSVATSRLVVQLATLTPNSEKRPKEKSALPRAAEGRVAPSSRTGAPFVLSEPLGPLALTRPLQWLLSRPGEEQPRKLSGRGLPTPTVRPAQRPTHQAVGVGNGPEQWPLPGCHPPSPLILTVERREVMCSAFCPLLILFPTLPTVPLHSVNPTCCALVARGVQDSSGNDAVRSQNPLCRAPRVGGRHWGGGPL